MNPESPTTYGTNAKTTDTMSRIRIVEFPRFLGDRNPKPTFVVNRFTVLLTIAVISPSIFRREQAKEKEALLELGQQREPRRRLSSAGAA
ncbi:hypothetical protein HPP92_009120 [Vanilla planifolia]|uniref:Uncharacterized protein n=1 Tax=Vanilla planifolia TaxID=51239 RepID=A0A835R9D9_VANPL|nr:hypothetical protein HPP92_009120 [Vanilla planifolia]